ncbi:MAG: type I-E CRISPR-associated protein Cas5/CasD [Firmicutes bacterium ZCTH02-B6]|nr:MAG: type I-E CRISPR-associated protein Cas5/CasD [Firmicutes bacterium ZCTH02-B6]
MPTLLLRLEGPMQSWGTSSRFTQRDTGTEPSKSGVIGLICAALGKPRREIPGTERQWPSLATLASLQMGVRTDRAGTVAVDFQTAGGGRFAGEKYGVAHVHGGLFGSVMSYRYFLQDASFTVGLFSPNRDLLEQIQRALESPVWQLYLGRKGYLPSVPPYLKDGLVDSDLRTALASYPFAARHDQEMRLIIETTDPVGAEPRMDQPLDFARRLFGRRYVRVEPLVPKVAGS